MAIGVATAELHGSGPPPTARVATEPSDSPTTARDQATAEYVWPSAAGSVRGQALGPLYPHAPGLAKTNPDLYRVLSLVDLIRIGGARESAAAIDAIALQLAY